MGKKKMVERGATVNVLVPTLRSWQQFFGNFAIRKKLTAKNAKDSQSSQSTSCGLKCKLRHQRRLWSAMGVVILVGVAVGQTKQEVDLIVSGGIVVTMDGARGILHDGSVAVKDDSIVAVGPRADLEGRYHGAQTIEARGRLVLPGFINGHTHVPMTLFRGLHDDVTLSDWLYKYIFPAEAKNVNEEFVRWGTRLAAAEQIRSGVTTFADMYYFEDAVAEETKAAGMRGVLGETFIDFPAPDNKTNTEMLAYAEKFLKRWQGDPLIHAAPAPHSIYTCSKKTIQDAAELARKYHAPLLMHVSEMKKEWEDSEKTNGMSPVQYLEKIGVLGPDLVAAHCIFVDEADRKLLAERQVGCVHNPSSNMMIASGVSPVPEMRAAGVAVGLGTDGPAGSNNDLDLMEEIDLAAKLAKISKMDPLALNAKAVVEMATIGGARALHMEKEIGSLEAGKKADLILVSLDEPNAVPMYDVYAQIAYSLKGSDVETVVIGGRVVMRERKLLTVDEARVLEKAREYGKSVKASLGME
jgi:5-methylthioadenosine/S-adenosylhomocysteine deaminase